VNAAMSKIYIGTSGWTYDDWRGPFYPQNMPKKRWLAWYATQFPTAEINGSFYRTPSLATVEGWHDATPRQFTFAWKASKFITHWKRLSEKSRDSIALMVSRLEVLGGKAGPVLFQLPPRFTVDHKRLEAFLAMLPKAYRYVFEFRDKSWYDDAILSLLHRHKVALCISDHHDAPAPFEVTARHVYVRGHGPGGDYRGNYPDNTLRRWTRAIDGWKEQRRTVYVYFDNDQKSAAPTDARRLIEMVG
jgi:uncharacterized protein YecE (DUF72 family)